MAVWAGDVTKRMPFTPFSLPVNRLRPTPFGIMTTSTQQPPVLKFDDKQYSLDSLSDTAKQAVTALRTAEAQIRMAKDQLNLLALGRQALLGQLKAELEGVEPITAQ